jgi:hypothetical protein
MKIPKLLSIIVPILFAGCATAYKADGFTGGFTETKLAPDIVRVTFRGNGYTKRERVQDFAFLRAAELAISDGYLFFVILNESNDSKMSSFSTGGYAQTSGTAYMSGNRAYYSGQTTYSPVQTYNIYKPESGLLVRFLKVKPDDGLAFDAAFLISALKVKYGIK